MTRALEKSPFLPLQSEVWSMDILPSFVGTIYASGTSTLPFGLNRLNGRLNGVIEVVE